MQRIILSLLVMTLFCDCDRKKVSAPLQVYHLNQSIEFEQAGVRVVDHGPSFVLLDGDPPDWSKLAYYQVIVEISNRGNRRFTFRPGHGRMSVRADDYPLLRDGRGRTVKHIVFSEHERPNWRKLQTLEVKKGKPVRIRYLFALPADDARRLSMRIPGKPFGGPSVLVKFPVSRRRPPLPPAVLMNKGHTVGAFELRVRSVKLGFLNIRSGGRLGRSAEKLLSIEISVKNTTGKPLSYTPPILGRVQPGLWTASRKPIQRVAFDQRVDGQLHKRRLLKAGAMIRDRLLFQLPDPQSPRLFLHYPAQLLGARGLLRISLPNPRFRKSD